MTVHASCHECEWRYTAEAEDRDAARAEVKREGAAHVQEFPDHHVLIGDADGD